MGCISCGSEEKCGGIAHGGSRDAELPLQGLPPPVTLLWSCCRLNLLVALLSSLLGTCEVAAWLLLQTVGAAGSLLNCCFVCVARGGSQGSTERQAGWRASLAELHHVGQPVT